MPAPVPGVSPLCDLQKAYAEVCAAIRDFFVNPKPNYTLPGGASADRDGYIRYLRETEEGLRKIPGVAPSTNPVFQIDQYLSGGPGGHW